ncbi:hypothetical protein MLD38_036668 [Melastoma candidum]|uniref:Uncharacterized protein n=1 Tax=Melastoma candidum TaxID=119954 RepID=A0ACB9LLL3_9MYRT|nr:hypothetical protein MLD38_036668 [Melastoma candidum]
MIAGGALVNAAVILRTCTHDSQLLPILLVARVGASSLLGLFRTKSPSPQSYRGLLLLLESEEVVGVAASTELGIMLSIRRRRYCNSRSVSLPPLHRKLLLPRMPTVGQGVRLCL